MLLESRIQYNNFSPSKCTKSNVSSLKIYFAHFIPLNVNCFNVNLFLDSRLSFQDGSIFSQFLFSWSQAQKTLAGKHFPGNQICAGAGQAGAQAAQHSSEPVKMAQVR